MKTPSPAKTNTLQTLDRGLQVLALIATRAGGWSIAELAAELDVHRAIAYRLVATLEQHGLIARLKNRRNDPDRLDMKKFCPTCGHHTDHRETR